MVQFQRTLSVEVIAGLKHPTRNVKLSFSSMSPGRRDGITISRVKVMFQTPSALGCPVTRCALMNFHAPVAGRISCMFGKRVG